MHTALRLIDLLALAIALPVFVVAGWPLAGYAVGAAIWVIWRSVGEWAAARTRALGGDLQKVAVLQGAASIGRGWLLLLGVLAAGLLISREVGLSAALLLLAIQTLSLSLRMALRPFAGPTHVQPSS